MKILIYTENYSPGGGNRYIVDFINSVPIYVEILLVSNCDGFTLHDKCKVSRPVDYMEVSIKKFNLRIKTNCRILNKFISIVTKYNFIKNYIITIKHLIIGLINKNKMRKIIYDDILSGFIFNGGFPGGFSCFDMASVLISKKIKTCISLVSMPSDLSIVETYYKTILKNTDCFIVNCNAIKNKLIESKYIRENKVKVLYNCVNSNDIYIKQNTNEKLIIGYIGRVEKSKGVFVLINALKELIKYELSFKVVLIGKIYNEEIIVKLLKESNLSNIVELHGFYEGDINEVYKNIDIFVFPSLWEGFPYSILEAMSHGLPVISSNVGGISEVINEESGILVEPNNSSELSAAIKKILVDKNLRDKISKGAYHRIANNFTYEVYANRVKDFFK